MGQPSWVSLSVDPDDVIKATEQDEREALDYSQKFTGFRGEIEFDWTVAFLGQSVTRKVQGRVLSHTRLGVLRSNQECAL
jgi:hypothetical protein